MPAVQQSIGKVTELQKENETLVAGTHILREEKETIIKENASLKQDIIRNKPQAILIKNMPLHHEYNGIQETSRQTTNQISKLLTLMEIPNLKLKSIYRWPTRPGKTATYPTIKITFFDKEEKKLFMKRLFKLKSSDFVSIRAQPVYPSFLKNELIEKERLMFMIRREKKTRTRLILKDEKLIIQFLHQGFWIIYDQQHPEQNQPIIFNTICPKILRK